MRVGGDVEKGLIDADLLHSGVSSFKMDMTWLLTCSLPFGTCQLAQIAWKAQLARRCPPGHGGTNAEPRAS